MTPWNSCRFEEISSSAVPRISWITPIPILSFEKNRHKSATKVKFQLGQVIFDDFVSVIEGSTATFCPSIPKKWIILVELFSSIFLWNFFWFFPTAKSTKIQWRDGSRFLIFLFFAENHDICVLSPSKATQKWYLRVFGSQNRNFMIFREKKLEKMKIWIRHAIGF